MKISVRAGDFEKSMQSILSFVSVPDRKIEFKYDGRRLVLVRASTQAWCQVTVRTLTNAGSSAKFALSSDQLKSAIRKRDDMVLEYRDWALTISDASSSVNHTLSLDTDEAHASWTTKLDPDTSPQGKLTR